MRFTTKILIIASGFSFGNCVEEFPSTIIQRCKYEDDKCMVNASNKYEKLADTVGIPELSLPHSHQIFVKKQVLQFGSPSSSLNLKIAFRDVNVTGLATATYENVTLVINENKNIELYNYSERTVPSSVPFMSIKGHYEATGKLILLPVSGSGEGEIEYHNTTFYLTVYTKTEILNGEEHLVVSKVHCDYKCARNHFKFDNFLRNNDADEVVNKILNDNKNILNQEMIQPTATSFARVFKEILNSIFKRYPYRNFFLD